MIIDYYEIKAFGKAIFQRGTIQAPFRSTSTDLAKEQNSACFFYLLDGNYESYSHNEKVELGAKEGLVKKCGNFILNYLKVSESKECKAVLIYFYPEILQEVFKDELPQILIKESTKSTFQKVTSNELIDKYIESLLFYFENPALVDDTLAALKLKELILLLLKTDKNSSLVELISDFFSPRIISFKEVIESHLYQEMSVEELAYLAGLSLSSFKREFKKIYKDTPAHYIRNKKLEKAAELLKNPEHRVGDVAFECGFHDLANFSVIFQKKYGASPKNYQMNQIPKSLD